MSWRIVWRSAWPEAVVRMTELERFTLRLGERADSPLVAPSQLIAIERIEEGEGAEETDLSPVSSASPTGSHSRGGDAPPSTDSGTPDAPLPVGTPELLIEESLRDLAVLYSLVGDVRVRIAHRDLDRLIARVGRNAGLEANDSVVSELRRRLRRRARRESR